MESRTEHMIVKSNMQISDGKFVFKSLESSGKISLLDLKPSVPEDTGFIFYDSEQNVLICHVGITNKRERLEVSYGTEEPFRNKGYMTEALSFVVTWIFDSTTENQIWALPNGPISKSILEKCGFIDCGSDDSYQNINWFKLERASLKDGGE